MKKVVSIFLVLIFVFSLTACSQMPFNGDIEFHDISLTIPERFIRDSTQSNDNLWVFECDNYSEYIINNMLTFSTKVNFFIFES